MCSCFCSLVSLWPTFTLQCSTARRRSEFSRTTSSATSSTSARAALPKNNFVQVTKPVLSWNSLEWKMRDSCFGLLNVTNATSSVATVHGTYAFDHAFTLSWHDVLHQKAAKEGAHLRGDKFSHALPLNRSLLVQRVSCTRWLTRSACTRTTSSAAADFSNVSSMGFLSLDGMSFDKKSRRLWRSFDQKSVY